MDKKILGDAIKLVGLHAQAKVLWLVHPLLEQLAMKYANYVTLHSVAENGRQPLLAVAMKDAFTKYKAATKVTEDDRAHVGAFVRSLIDSSADVFSQKIVVATSRGDVAWSPFVCSLTEFLAQHPGAEVRAGRQRSNIPAAIATAFMMSRIIPHSLLDSDSLAELLNEIKVPS
jgi:hypothetical protein